MVSMSVRAKVWYDLLEISRISRYFEVLGKRYKRAKYTTRILLAVSGVGVVTSLLNLLPYSLLPYKETVAAVSGVVIAIVALLDMLVDPGATADALDAIRRYLTKYEFELRNLWERIEAGLVDDDDKALTESSEILRNAQYSAESVSLNTRKRLNRKCAAETYAVETKRYAA